MTHSVAYAPWPAAAAVVFLLGASAWAAEQETAEPEGAGMGPEAPSEVPDPQIHESENTEDAKNLIQPDSGDLKKLQNGRTLFGFGVGLYIIAEIMTIISAGTLAGWKRSQDGDWVLGEANDSMSYAIAHYATLGGSLFFKPIAVSLMLGGTSLQARGLSGLGLSPSPSFWTAGLVLFGFSLLGHIIGPGVAIKTAYIDGLSYAFLALSALETLSVICLVIHEARLMHEIRSKVDYFPRYSYDPEHRIHMVSMGWIF